MHEGESGMSHCTDDPWILINPKAIAQQRVQEGQIIFITIDFSDPDELCVIGQKLSQMKWEDNELTGGYFYCQRWIDYHYELKEDPDGLFLEARDKTEYVCSRWHVEDPYGRLKEPAKRHIPSWHVSNADKLLYGRFAFRPRLFEPDAEEIFPRLAIEKLSA
jgi:hypothetical protein